jgi:hypothetical protein
MGARGHAWIEGKDRSRDLIEGERRSPGRSSIAYRTRSRTADSGMATDVTQGGYSADCQSPRLINIPGSPVGLFAG